MDKQIIRKATNDDIENGLLDIYIEGYKYHQNNRPDIFQNVSNEQLKNVLLSNVKHLSCFVALNEEGRIVGYIAYKICNNNGLELNFIDVIPSNSAVINIHELVVTESYRGKGYGEKLMTQVIADAHENNSDRIELNCYLFNNEAIELYKKMGFQVQRSIFEMKINK